LSHHTPKLAQWGDTRVRGYTLELPSHSALPSSKVNATLHACSYANNKNITILVAIHSYVLSLLCTAVTKQFFMVEIFIINTILHNLFSLAQATTKYSYSQKFPNLRQVILQSI